MFTKIAMKCAENIVKNSKNVKKVAGGIAAVASAATLASFVGEKGGRMYLRAKKGRNILGAFKEN